ncbi:SMI1/KNR4 family protein [Snodgrassella sp. ESL0324]|uniref:SMI1/KNR4 family protein n=1 Tax=Snodgrassella sp. ESL0324 TaxID=2705033 RepID=UPI0015827FFE|nr:SMI1/KNR4 family protein [Snodgrassella sp. ESL0324]NUF09150.1 SMI1/KNR4 family protein [Snodgrassella sp. ESL0324]
MFQSKYTVPEDIDKLISKLKLKKKSHSSYINFLKQYNVIDFYNMEFCYGIDCEGEELPLEVILGFSKKEDEDLIATNYAYLNRIPEKHIAIATVNYGDLLCLDPNGKIYHWDHEVNDLYFDMKVINGYLEQNTNLKFVADSFDQFLSMITKTEEDDDDYDPSEDEFKNPNIPFPDESLNIWFKDPKSILLPPERAIPIYLKKFKLSEKGRELLEKFKKLELTEKDRERIAILKKEGFLEEGIFE